MSSTLRKPPGSLATMYPLRTFRSASSKPDVETTNPGSSKARREGCTCPVVANNYGAGPSFTTDPACVLHGDRYLPAIEPGELRCQRCAHAVEGRKRFCTRCLAATAKLATRRWHQAHLGDAGYRLTCRCGAEFTAHDKRVQWCPPCRRIQASENTRRRWAEGNVTLHPKVCVDCGQSYQPRSPSQLHCGCVVVARRARGASAPRRYHWRFCIDCGLKFRPTGPRHLHCGCAKRAHEELRGGASTDGVVAA